MPAHAWKKYIEILTNRHNVKRHFFRIRFVDFIKYSTCSIFCVVLSEYHLWHTNRNYIFSIDRYVVIFKFNWFCFVLVYYSHFLSWSMPVWLFPAWFFLITIGFSFKSDQDIDSALIRRWPSSSHFSLRDILLFTPVGHLRDRISLICFLPFIFVFHLAFNHFPDICSLLLYSVPLTK